ncbi:prephenate dehydratase [Blattabacterium cuenoti]|uniref:prephenate dehydratase n=1 Tax=Blattabacterium cuenoti TaxID=1653831 RepID=UPI00163C2DC7|nr:prephenate dehydratase [Blattabacterium cuenoti]
MNVIAIQGIKGSFHHSAASKYFENYDFQLMECYSFRELASYVAKSDVDFGVMAIENTIAGTILTNYNLIYEYNLKIIGEIFIPIKHYLIAYPGQKIEDIKEIISHPMALLQCQLFIDTYNYIKISEYSDTAAAAKYISYNKKKKIAAIASKKASIEYGLEILYNNIQTINNNFTRFFILKSSKNSSDKKYNNIFNKASLILNISHTTGSLSKILSLISNFKINMTKIQSIPIVYSPWEYSFYIDIVFDNINNYEKMKKKIKKISFLNKILIMGEYKNGIYN